MVERVTEHIIKELVQGGLQRGTMQTDLGEVLVLTAMKGGLPCMTVTFVDVEEKWLVQGELIQAMKYVEAGNGVAVPDKPLPAPRMTVGKPVAQPVAQRVKVEGEERKRITTAVDSPIAPVTQALKETLIKKEERKVKAKKEVEPKGPVAIKLTVSPDAPRVERPKTAIGRAKARGQSIPEQPPTVRAYKGKPVMKEAKVRAVKKQYTRKLGLQIPLATVSKKTGKVPKIGPKEPVWRRQLGWNGKPEKVDINLYPHKIICVEDGQPRYVDNGNYGIKSHPVTLCKPCQKRKRSKAHDAAVKARKARLKAEAVKEAKKALKAVCEPLTAAPKQAQEPRKPKKGTPVKGKGGKEAVKAAEKPKKGKG